MTLDIGVGHRVTPDISLIPRQSMDLLNDEIRVTTPPVTVVEIVSPSQTLEEMMKKVHGYLAKGVQSCWLIDPSLHQVIIFNADGRRKIFSEGVVALLAARIRFSMPGLPACPEARGGGG